jgi:hypothetical protein
MNPKYYKPEFDLRFISQKVKSAVDFIDDTNTVIGNFIIIEGFGFYTEGLSKTISITIDISHLNFGIYFYYMSSEDGIAK